MAPLTLLTLTSHFLVATASWGSQEVSSHGAPHNTSKGGVGADAALLEEGAQGGKAEMEAGSKVETEVDKAAREQMAAMTADMKSKFSSRDAPVVQTLENSQLYYQVPPAMSNLEGVLFLAHGCGKSAKSWWEKSPSCLNCTGLPEETRIVKAALKKELLVVAMSAMGQDGCWEAVKEKGNDAVVVAGALQAFTHFLEKEQGFSDGVPIYAMGAQEGGKFVQALQLFLPGIVGLASLGAEPDTQLGVFQKDAMGPSLRGVCFLVLERDVDSIANTNMTLEKTFVENPRLNRNNSKVFLLETHPITDSYFADRIKDVNELVSAEIAVAMTKFSLLQYSDPTCTKNCDFELTCDPTDTENCPWREALEEAANNEDMPDLKEHLQKHDSLIEHRSAISQELNVAFAMRETSSDLVDEVLQFLLDLRKKERLALLAKKEKLAAERRARRQQFITVTRPDDDNAVIHAPHVSEGTAIIVPARRHHEPPRMRATAAIYEAMAKKKRAQARAMQNPARQRLVKVRQARKKASLLEKAREQGSVSPSSAGSSLIEGASKGASVQV